MPMPRKYKNKMALLKARNARYARKNAKYNPVDDPELFAPIHRLPRGVNPEFKKE